MRAWMWLPVLVLLLSSGVAPAQQEVVIYKCTDASGAQTFQNNERCPKGSREERKVLEAPAPSYAAPAYVPPPMPASPATARPAVPSAPTPPPAVYDTAADAERLPPPVLYECTTYDKDRYLSESGEAQQRCAPLATNDLGGLSGSGASSCQMVSDRCQRIPDGAVCAAWKQRLGEAEAGLRFGRSETREIVQAERDRVARIVAESTCAQAAKP